MGGKFIPANAGTVLPPVSDRVIPIVGVLDKKGKRGRREFILNNSAACDSVVYQTKELFKIKSLRPLFPAELGDIFHIGLTQYHYQHAILFNLC